MGLQFLSAPPIQHWSYAARFAAHTALWTLWLTALEALVGGAVALLRRSHVKRSARKPQLSWARMLLDSTLGYVGWTWPLGLYVAWLNPGAPGGFAWDYSLPPFLPVVYFSLATLMAYDAWSYFSHRWMHVNKTAFVWLHAKHHEHQAALDVRTSGYMSIYEGIFSDALPLLAIYALGSATGNWWYCFAACWNAFFTVFMGHCGHDISLTHERDSLMLLLNPAGYGFMGCPVHNKPKVHEDHHTQPRKNYAFFFSYWDDLYGTASNKLPHCTLIVLFAHGLCQLSHVAFIQLLISHTLPFTAWLLLQLLIPPTAAAAVAEWLQLPEATRRLFGWFVDLYRRDSLITYAPPGSPGSFKPTSATSSSSSNSSSSSTPVIAASSNGDAGDDTAPLRDHCHQRLCSTTDDDTAAAAAASDVGVTPSVSAAAPCKLKPPVYLFACHPTGLISRGAFLTFGARGWSSPVSGLPKVRLAIADILYSWPGVFAREALLACGCIPAEWSLLKRTLLSGTSVALTPGGWAESKYLQTYKLVLQMRRGFVALAAETGAHLVPVLCLGEQDLVGAPEPGFMLNKWLVPSRVKPVHVVFGEPLVPGPDESVSQLHCRYVKALMALGKQHDVKLEVVE